MCLDEFVECQNMTVRMLVNSARISFIHYIVVVIHVQQDRRNAAKPETSGSRPSTPSSQQSSTDHSSKGIVSFVVADKCLSIARSLS